MHRRPYARLVDDPGTVSITMELASLRRQL